MPDDILRLITEQERMGVKIVSITERILRFEPQDNLESICGYFQNYPLSEDQLEELASHSAIEAEEVAPELEGQFETVEIDYANLPQAREYSSECIPNVAERIREAMKKRGLSQTKLAELANVTPQAVSKFLARPENSKLTTIARIAQAMNVDIGTFFRPISD